MCIYYSFTSYIMTKPWHFHLTNSFCRNPPYLRHKGRQSGPSTIYMLLAWKSCWMKKKSSYRWFVTIECLYDITVMFQLKSDVSGVKIGLVKESLDSCEPEVANVVKEAAAKLQKAGALVEEVSVASGHMGETSRASVNMGTSLWCLKSNDCKSLKGRATVHLIYGCPIFKWVSDTCLHDRVPFI